MSKGGAQKTSSPRFKPYPAYKESGVEWLREIPANWETYSLRRKLFREAGSIKIGPFGSQLKLEFMTQEGFKVYGQEHVIARDFGLGNKYVDQAKFSELAACEIRPHDLVITMMGSSGRCAVVPQGIQRGIMDSHLLRVRLPDAEIDPRFLCLLIDESPYVKDQIGALGKGAIMHGLNSSIIKSILLAVPPLPDQLDILAFFDRETTRIDALVAKKERLIELLQEKRAALITQAVTKGLDPKAPMKDSGVEWLGQIPAHWKIKKLKYVVKGGLVNGLFKKKDQYGTGVKLINVVNLYEKNFHIDFETLEYVEADQGELKTFLVSPGDIFFVRSSLKLEGIGSAACATVVPEPAVFECHLVRVRPSQTHISPEYLVYYLNSTLVRQRLIALAETTTMTTIAQPKLASLDTVIPSHSAQGAIVAYLDQETTKFDALVAKVRDGIDRLKEYRTALISAAVTGKIDVKGEAA